MTCTFYIAPYYHGEEPEGDGRAGRAGRQKVSYQSRNVVWNQQDQFCTGRTLNPRRAVCTAYDAKETGRHPSILCGGPVQPSGNGHALALYTLYCLLFANFIG
jgi:hypothetical protein